jgi:hypothetical protein
MLTIDLHIVQRLRISGVIPLLLLCASVGWKGETVHLYFIELWNL